MSIHRGMTALFTTSLLRRPSLVVFDLDYTLWPFWTDTHPDPPFHVKDGKVYDRKNWWVRSYPDVPDMLESLHEAGILLAVASRTSYIADAKKLVELFDWTRYFSYMEIYPGDKRIHFDAFSRKSSVPFQEMLFFDDERRNVVSVSGLGVHCVHAEDGMSIKVLRDGLEQFSIRRTRKDAANK